MSENRHAKIQEAIQHAASQFLSREAGPQSLITVTRVLLSDDGKTADVYISVLPVTAESSALAFCKRERSAVKHFLRTNVRMHPIPVLDFVIDEGEKNRQRIDELMRS